MNNTEVMSNKNREKSDIEHLIQALSDNERFVRMNAAIALGKIGEEKAIEVLAKTLNDKSELVRMNAAIALGKIGKEEAIEVLAKTLHDESIDYRLTIIEILCKIGDPVATHLLIKLLNDEYFLVRGNAASALGKIGDPKAIDPLITLLKDKFSLVRGNAASALGKIGDPKAIDPIIMITFRHPDILKYSGFINYERIIVKRKAIIQIGELSFDKLSKILSSNNLTIKIAVLNDMFEINPNKSLLYIFDALKDKNIHIKLEAMKLLNKINELNINIDEKLLINKALFK
jgi:HEAT repeat protein